MRHAGYWAIALVAGMIVAAPASACGDFDFHCKQKNGQLNLQLPTVDLPAIDPGCRGDLCRFAKGAADESARAINNIGRELGKTPEAMKECLADLNKCAREFLASAPALLAQAYIDGLYRQAEGKVFSFSPEFLALAQPHYGIDLRGVTWADNIDTGHGMVVAYCDRIFFTAEGDLWNNKNELHLALHELEHLVQCQGRGRRTFLLEYVIKGLVDMGRNGTFNIHDMHEMEVSAEAKANRLTNQIWDRIHSGNVAVPEAARQRQQANGGQPFGNQPTGVFNQGSASPMPISSQLMPNTTCRAGDVFMYTPGGACCSADYSRCTNLTSGVVTCGGFGCGH